MRIGIAVLMLAVAGLMFGCGDGNSSSNIGGKTPMERSQESVGMNADKKIELGVYALTSAQAELKELADIRVSSAEGVVTISGSVPTEEWKTKVTDMAKSVEGVKEVKNTLAIKAME